MTFINTGSLHGINPALLFHCCTTVVFCCVKAACCGGQQANAMPTQPQELIYGIRLGK